VKRSVSNKQLGFYEAAGAVGGLVVQDGKNTMYFEAMDDNGVIYEMELLVLSKHDTAADEWTHYRSAVGDYVDPGSSIH